MWVPFLYSFNTAVCFTADTVLYCMGDLLEKLALPRYTRVWRGYRTSSVVLVILHTAHYQATCILCLSNSHAQFKQKTIEKSIPIQSIQQSYINYERDLFLLTGSCRVVENDALQINFLVAVEQHANGVLPSFCFLSISQFTDQFRSIRHTRTWTSLTNMLMCIFVELCDTVQCKRVTDFSVVIHCLNFFTFPRLFHGTKNLKPTCFKHTFDSNYCFPLLLSLRVALNLSTLLSGKIPVSNTAVFKHIPA